MLIDQIYRRRFHDEKNRKILWSILVKKFFQKYVDKGDTVLDIPCGYAEFINTIKCKKKVAVDINPDAKKHVDSGVVFLQNYSNEIKLPSASVDKIFVSNFFEHIERSEILETISEFKRVLKKHGKVLILQPNIRFASKNYWMFFDHITPIDDRALEEVFTVNDFKLKQRILKFLPYTSQSKLPATPFVVKLYLSIPLLWRLFGKQTFMVFEK